MVYYLASRFDGLCTLLSAAATITGIFAISTTLALINSGGFTKENAAKVKWVVVLFVTSFLLGLATVLTPTSAEAAKMMGVSTDSK